MIVIALLLQVASGGEGFRLTSTPDGAYVFEQRGAVTDAGGATLILRSSHASPGTASLQLVLSADSLRLKSVRVVGELHAREIGTGNVYLRVDGPTRRTGSVNALDRGISGSAQAVPLDLAFPVPEDSRSVTLGITLRGSGQLEVRGLRVTSSPLPPPGAPMGDSARTVLDSAITIVKRQSIWRDTVTWTVVEPEVRRLAAGTARVAEIRAALSVLINRLGDNHSSILPPRQASAFRAGGSENPPPSVRSLASGVGVMIIGGYFGGDAAAMRDYTVTAHASLLELLPTVRCGWIVDLRENGGGNMWPMLAALRPFLGDGAIGSFVGSGGEHTTWRAGAGVDAEPPAALRSLESAPVAVLHGSRTASSGEAVTIAFRGRPHTRSFGQPTAGLSNANSMFPLPDGSMLNLTVALDADRNGVTYGGRVPPDVALDVPPSEASDGALKAAEEWLTARCDG